MNQQELIEENIRRMEKRKSEVWKFSSPYIKPLWEISEINVKIKELKKNI